MHRAKIAIIVKNDRKESENKTIRFPMELLDRIEETLEGTEINFSRFVIQACEYALGEMEPSKKRKEETHS